MSNRGIDVSSWQETIDWSKVKNDGIEFAILREGYRKQADNQFFNNVNGAKNAGVQIPAVYHFCYAINLEEVEAEFNSCLANVQKAGLGKETIIFMDFEYDTVKKAAARGVTLNKSHCISFSQRFCELVEKAGYQAGIYCNLDYYRNMYSSELLSKYTLWLAEYNSKDTTTYPCKFHQYTSSGKVAGIAGNVDMNYGDIEKTTNKGETTMTESEARNLVVAKAQADIGASEYSTKHKNIINDFNNAGLCSRYRMTYNDAWCATATSVWGYRAFGKNSPIKFECSCTKQISMYGSRYTSNRNYVPKKGDIIFYNWDGGAVDHTGIVESVSGNTITVIEGNYSNNCKRRNITVGWSCIAGYGLPNYSQVSNGTSSGGTTTPSTNSGNAPSKTTQWTGTVTADSLNVRTWAGTENGTCSFSPLSKGASVAVCDSVKASDGSTWYYINYNGKFGFVHSAYVSKTAATTTTPSSSSNAPSKTVQWTGKVTASAGLNLRSWAGTGNKILRTVPYGTTLYVCDSIKASDGSTWYYVKTTDGKFYFAHSAYVK